MADYDPEREAAALAELDNLTDAFNKAAESLNQAREALQEGFVRHLRERNAPPGKVADHTPYDRNHVTRIARAAGVPPLRERTVVSAKGRRKPKKPDA